jgi:serine/threonine-protein kinase
VHGDVKPANVLLDGQGVVKVVDFGFARVLGELRRGAEPDEPVSGTPHYMAPEVLRGERRGFTADVWSLGVLIHRMASGRLPFEADDLEGLFRAIHASEAPPLDAASPALRAIVRDCLAKNPQDRPATAGDVRDALERMLEMRNRVA